MENSRMPLIQQQHVSTAIQPHGKLTFNHHVFRLEQGYQLRVNVWIGVPQSIVVRVRATVLEDVPQANGQPSYRVMERLQTITPTANKTNVQSIVLPLCEGELIAVQVSTETTSALVTRGTVFVQCFLEYSTTAAALAFNIAILFSDYLTTVSPLQWPGTPVRSSLDGPGAILNDTSSVVPVNGARSWQWFSGIVRVRPIVATLMFQADATVITRAVSTFEARSNAVTVFNRVSANPTIIAGQAQAVMTSVLGSVDFDDLANGSLFATSHILIPSLYIPASTTTEVIVGIRANVQAGDTTSATLEYEMWIDI
jgi:hypothetical protein